MKAERTPWAAWLAAALRMGLAPHAFWRLSLKEWRSLAAPRDPTLTHTDLTALMVRFPDP